MPFKIGAVKMAEETKSVIVPFVITSKYNAGFRKRRIQIEFLKGMKISSDLDSENKKLMKSVASKLEEYNERIRYIETKDDKDTMEKVL